MWQMHPRRTAYFNEKSARGLRTKNFYVYIYKSW